MAPGTIQPARAVLGRRAAILLLLGGVAAAAVGVAWGLWQAAWPGGSPVSRGDADPIPRILAAAAEAAETAAQPLVLDIADPAEIDEARVIKGYLALRARLRPALERIGSMLAKLDPPGMERLGAALDGAPSAARCMVLQALADCPEETVGAFWRSAGFEPGSDEEAKYFSYSAPQGTSLPYSLVDRMTRSRRPEVRLNAIGGLGRTNDPIRAVRRLLELSTEMLDDRDREQVRWCIYRLGSRCTEAERTAVLDEFRDDRSARQYVWRAMSVSTDQPADDFLLGGFRVVALDGRPAPSGANRMELCLLPDRTFVALVDCSIDTGIVERGEWLTRSDHRGVFLLLEYERREGRRPRRLGDWGRDDLGPEPPDGAGLFDREEWLAYAGEYRGGVRRLFLETGNGSGRPSRQIVLTALAPPGPESLAGTWTHDGGGTIWSLAADGRIEFPEAAPGDVPWSSGRFELQGFQVEIRLKPRPDGAAERVLRAAGAPTGTVNLFLRDVAGPRRPPGFMLIRWPIR